MDWDGDGEEDKFFDLDNVLLGPASQVLHR